MTGLSVAAPLLNRGGAGTGKASAGVVRTGSPPNCDCAWCRMKIQPWKVCPGSAIPGPSPTLVPQSRHVPSSS